MEIGKQIKKYRSEIEVSQEELAERIFVSRQTISNWENDKNYPDLKSLVLLSSLFGVSLDILIKGDIEQMKEEIKIDDIKYFKRHAAILTVLMLLMILSAFPLIVLPTLMFFLTIRMYIRFGIWIFISAVTMFWGLRIEKLKKKYDIQSYKEIIAFYEGKTLGEIDKHRELGKRPYQKFLVVIVTALITIAVILLMYFLCYIFVLH